MKIILAILAVISAKVVVFKQPNSTNRTEKIAYIYKPDKTLPNWEIREKRFLQKFHTNTITVVKEVK